MRVLSDSFEMGCGWICHFLLCARVCLVVCVRACVRMLENFRCKTRGGRETCVGFMCVTPTLNPDSIDTQWRFTDAHPVELRVGVQFLWDGGGKTAKKQI